MYIAKSRSELSPDNIKDIVPWIAFGFCLLFTFFIKNVQYNYETSNLVNEKGFIFILSFIVAAIFCIILAADRNIVFSVNGPRTEISMEVIHTAAKESNLTLLKDEIRRGINPNLKNSDGAAPLHFAAEVGFQEGVEFLLASGATVDAKWALSWQGTALMAAAENNHYKVVETLLNAKANPNAKDDRGDTAIFFAARVSNLEIMKLLINHGAEINLVGGSHFGLLSEAAKSAIDFKPNPKSGEVVKYLVEEKMLPVNESNILHKSPLYCASSILNVEAVEILVNHGAKINLNSEFETSILLEVARYRAGGDSKESALSVIRLLLKTGIDLNYKSNVETYDETLNLTLMEYAKKINDAELVQLLQGY